MRKLMKLTGLCEICRRYSSSVYQGTCPVCNRKYHPVLAVEVPLGVEAANPAQIDGYTVGEKHPSSGGTP